MPPLPVRSLRALLAAVLFALVPPLHAQTGTAPPSLRGTTLDGRPVDLARLRDKVVLVVFWSTDCAVCRDKMPELRANATGWRGQPFELLGVSTDRDRRQLQTYERLVEVAVPPSHRFPTVWRGEAGHQDSFGDPGTLPAAFLLDKQGRVVEHYNGRIPPQTWDRIAELL